MSSQSWKLSPKFGEIEPNFDRLRLDFPGLGGYFDVPDTVNNLLMALVSSEMDTAIFFEPLLWSFWAEIEPHFTLRLKE